MKSVRVMIVAFTLAVTLGGCATTAANTTPRVVALNPSWAEAYPTVAEMSRNAGAIAEITVEEVAGVEGADGAVYTSSIAHVDNWISTSSGTPDRITIRQLGGAAQDVTFVVDDDPLLEVGDRQLVFLRELAPGQYVIQGGPTGHLPADGATLRALPGSACADAFPSTLTKTLASIRASVAKGSAKSKLVG